MKDICSYLSVLNPEQCEAVCHTGSPLLILAGAGSGKTRVITTKIAWLIAEQGVDPESILAVTFTNKAAREMAERAKLLDSRATRSVIRTFHSFGAWFLRRYADWVGLSPNFTIYDDEAAVTLLMKALPQLNKQEAQGFMRKISRAKDYCLSPDNPQLKMIDPAPDFATVYREYQHRLQETGNADFGDLIMLPVRLLQEHPVIAGHLHNRFKVILVDEYQDSNSAQFQLLKEMTGPNTYLCVVGDDDQSIYRFRGAELQNILTFDQHFAHTKIIRLVRNYRSYESILRVADSIVSRNEDRLGKTLIAARGNNGEKPRVYYLPSQDSEAELCVQLIKAAVERGGSYSDWAILYRTNAQSFSFETAFLHEKIPHKVIGTVKFYEREEIKDTLALLALIANGRDEIAFRRMVNKPVRGIGEVTQNKIIAYVRKALFTDSQFSVQGQQEAEANRIQADKSENSNDIPRALSSNGSANDSLIDNEDFISVLRRADKTLALSKKAALALQEFLECLQSLRATLAGYAVSIATATDDEQDNKTLFTAASDSTQPNTAAVPEQSDESLAAFILTVIERSGLAVYHQNQDEVMGTQKMANLQELANAAALYPHSPTGLTAFLEHIELDRSLAEHTEEENAVQLITIHNTKGLEFRNVVITGLENGVFPRNDENNEDMEEERRLMYVACTRAQDALYMTSCATRRMYGKPTFMQPSRFLLEIESDLVEMSGQPSLIFNEPSDDESLLWKCGQRIFHDDYGYGYVVQSRQRGGELIITVQFETGYQKQFFPVYQKHELLRVSE